MEFTNSELRVVIVDDNANRRDLIKSYLPSYMDASVSNNGEEAIDCMLSEVDEKPDLVILYADDAKGKGLKTFELMQYTHRSEKLFMIPVLLVTKDEFSDRCLEFLEIGDVSFYEYKDEIDENELYSALMDALDRGTLMEEADFEEFPPVYKETPSSPDKLMGMAFVMDEHDLPQRCAVVHGNNRVKEILKSVKDSKEKATEVRRLIENENEERKKLGMAPIFLPSKDNKKEPKKITKNKPKPTKPPIRLDADTAENLYRLNNQSVGIILSEESEIKETPYSDFSIANILKKNTNNQTQQNNQPQAAANPPKQKNGKKRVLIIDTDARTEKACQLFLDESYEIILVDSGMKAIDFFIKNTADVVLLEYNLPALNGERVMASIRLQPLGRNVPVIMMFNKDVPLDVKTKVSCNREIKSFVHKPITKKQLVAAVNFCFQVY